MKTVRYYEAVEDEALGNYTDVDTQNPEGLILAFNNIGFFACEI